MADGTMPNIAALAHDGSCGPLLTQHPPLSPLVWTTMMTGVSPLRHRILDFTRFNPITRQREPITSDERAVPAIWNMVSAQGRRVDVVGLWATYPPEAVNGTIVSDREIVQEGGTFGFINGVDVSSILARLGLRDRTQAVVRAVRMGIIRLD